MSGNSYSGAAGSPYDRSKYASRGISVVAGIAALVGTAYSTLAQEAQSIAYKDTNLAQFGVPSVDGQQPSRTKWLDMTLNLPGAESRFDVYQTSGGLVATYTIDNKLYGVLHDEDGKKPLDAMYLDMSGNGNFEPYPPRKRFSAPDWATR